MKATSFVFKVLAVLASLATLTMFFLPFVTLTTADGAVTLKGIEVAFGSTQSYAGAQINTYKAAWYAFAFVTSALSVVFSALCFKKKGSGYASVAFSLVTMISMIVFACTSTHLVDWRPLPETGVSFTLGLGFIVALVASIAAFAISVASLLITDYAVVKESNGAKLTIPRRVVNFLKDYKSEIKKVVWPSRKTVVKNTAIVLIMCVVVGLYIAVLDFGLANLIGLVLGVDLYQIG